MASIRREVLIAAEPELVWDALRDWGALHERLVPGFVTDCRLDHEGARIVTFFTGTVAREFLIDLDDESRRLVWSIVEGVYTHHNGAAQVLAENGGSRFVWVTDLLPDELGPPTAQMMERGLQVLKETLEAAARSSRPA